MTPAARGRAALAADDRSERSSGIARLMRARRPQQAVAIRECRYSVDRDTPAAAATSATGAAGDCSSSRRLASTMRTRVRRESARSVAITYSADEVQKGQRARPTQQVIGAAPDWAALRTALPVTISRPERRSTMPETALLAIDMPIPTTTTTQNRSQPRRAAPPEMVSLRDEARRRDDVLLVYVNDNHDRWRRRVRGARRAGRWTASNPRWSSRSSPPQPVPFLPKGRHSAVLPNRARSPAEHRRRRARGAGRPGHRAVHPLHRARRLPTRLRHRRADRRGRAHPRGSRPGSAADDAEQHASRPATSRRGASDCSASSAAVHPSAPVAECGAPTGLDSGDPRWRR